MKETTHSFNESQQQMNERQQHTGNQIKVQPKEQAGTTGN